MGFNTNFLLLCTVRLVSISEEQSLFGFNMRMEPGFYWLETLLFVIPTNMRILLECLLASLAAGSCFSRCLFVCLFASSEGNFAPWRMKEQTFSSSGCCYKEISLR